MSLSGKDVQSIVLFWRARSVTHFITQLRNSTQPTCTTCTEVIVVTHPSCGMQQLVGGGALYFITHNNYYIMDVVKEVQ